ncbi:hypothetical protein TrVE_jg9471 [Triparma verrucosa]|uniref:ACB domain-containing protein n=1 Tax=Triparma verrucosa TaxID=1606542 RepID=A0A9W7C8Z7_9STRA|nr:hypothetical protein TrVE_jg9471 [Triparma verrucosa]
MLSRQAIKLARLGNRQVGQTRLFGVAEDFKSAVDTRSMKVRDLPDGVPKLELYALYKQATVGDVNTDRPGYTDFFARTKWDAWEELGGKSQEWAMEQYIAKTDHLASASDDKGGDAAAAKQRKVWPHHKPHTGQMMPDDTFKGRVALVTGGGTGLGKGMATMLSKLGATVIISSRKKEVLDKTAAEITALTGNQVHGVPMNVRDGEMVKAAIDEMKTVCGLPDIVINNAAGNFIAPSERLSSNAFATIVDTVLNGSAYVTLELSKKLMEEDRGGVFLYTTTTYASTGSGFVLPSACAKAGIEIMIKSLGAEWGRYGFRFLGIAPGPIPTKGAFDRLDPTGRFETAMLDMIPANRAGKVEEMANLAAFLVSPYASWISGEIVTLDGGETVQNAGEFNQLRQVSEQEWNMMEAMIRDTNKKGST